MKADEPGIMANAGCFAKLDYCWHCKEDNQYAPTTPPAWASTTAAEIVTSTKEPVYMTMAPPAY